ncbi:fumarylacetoacetase [Nocardioides lentus]|uniref:fumarylacetoacetase n=1 Tax=Nocardioides lentus TaxID=338077 RepID=A0ABP5ATD3_9ACTN
MSGFGPDHLPYGVFSTPGSDPRVGVRLGDGVIDLAFETGLAHFAEPSLDAFLALGPDAWADTRAEVTRIVTADSFELLPLASVTLHLPFTVADYTDFYCSEHHASAVGRLFRPSADPDADPLLPNWRHLPVGYHGRSGSVVVSGTPVARPRGQVAGPEGPSYGPTGKLDLEAELGFVVGAPTATGTTVAPRDVARHVFGVVGLNDWSARDVQAWEYRPLGPFLGKSFATSVSAWVTPLAALTRAWVPLPGQSPEPLPHLADTSRRPGLDVAVEVLVDGVVVSRPPYASTYWSPGQMLAHLTSNGAALRTGDLFASGTISGPDPEQAGSLLELTHDGTRPLAAFAGRPDADRTWLRDGDEVTLRFSAPGPTGGRLTLGEVTALITPA